MEFPERVSARITAAISEQLSDLPEQKLAEINYGIAVFIANSYKILLMFVAAALLNIMDYFIIALISFGTLRSFASGIHAKREWTCLPASLIIFLGIIFIGKSITLNIYSISTIFLLCFTAMLHYSPADTEERPIRSIKLRKKLRLISCFFTAAFYFAALFTIDIGYSTVITLSIMAETLLILPVTYAFTGNVYNAGIIINNKKEV